MNMKCALVLLAASGILFSGCSHNNTDSLKEHTADVTAAAKRDAGAIASGIVEGLQRKGPLNINSASTRQLTALPGITPPLARAIIEGRPYEDSAQLYKKHILTKAQYNRIRAQVVAGN